MKKRLFVLFLAVVVSLSLLIPAVASAKNVELSLWTHQRHMMEVIQELLDEFNSTIGEEKGVEVTLRVVGDDGPNILMAAQENGQGPDLYNVGTNYGSFAAELQAGAKIVWDGLPGFDEWKAQWPSWYWREGLTTYKGETYAIPVTTYNARLVYNKDLFEEAGLDPNSPPETYSDMVEYAAIIKEKTGKHGAAWPGADTWMNEWMPSQFVEASGVPAYFDWATGKWEFSNVAPLFQAIIDMKEAGTLFPGVTSLNNDALRAQFAAGNVGMFFAESWDIGVLNDQFPARCEWGVALPPIMDGVERAKSRASMSSGLWSINGQCKYPELAWEVVKFFSTYEARAKFYEDGKLMDPDPQVIAHATKAPTANGFAEFAETVDMDYQTINPYMPGWVSPSENYCMAFQSVLAKGGDVAAELQRVEDTWNEALDEFYAENPDVKRGWNIYPNFDRQTGLMGEPLEAISY